MKRNLLGQIVATFALTFLSICPIPGWGQEKVDSLIQVLNKTKDDSIRYSICIDLHNAYFRTHPKESREYAQELMTIAKKLGNKKFEFNANLALARCERKNRDYAKVIPYVLDNVKLAEGLKDHNLSFEAYHVLARDYLDAEDFTSLIPALKAGMKYAQKNNNTLQIAKINYVYGFYYAIVNQDSKALPYFEKAIKVFRSHNEHSLENESKLQYTVSALKALPPNPHLLRNLVEAVAYFNERNSKVKSAYCRSLIGMYYSYMGDYKQSVTNYIYARNLFKEHNNNVQYALAGVDMADVLLKKKEFRTAYTILDESENIFKENNYDQGNVILYIAKAKYNIHLNKLDLANNYLKKVKSLIAQRENNIYTKDYQRTLAIMSFHNKDTTLKNTALFNYYHFLFREFQTERNIIVRELLLLQQEYPDIHTSLPLLIHSVKDHVFFAKIKDFFATQKGDIQRIPDSLFIQGDLQKGNDTSNLFYQELDAIDAVVNKKLIQAELAAQQSEKKLVESQLWIAIIISISVLVLAILLIIYLRVVQKNKKRLEQDKSTIQSLQVQLNHLIENNLKSIGSFIDKAVSSSDSRQAIESLKNRVAVIHKFHENYKLQALKDNSLQGYDVDMQENIEHISEYLKSFFNYDDAFLKVNIDAWVNVTYNVGINLILLISELLQNSCKYAFNDDDVDKENLINISVRIAADGMLSLKYNDNGIGKPLQVHSGLGTELIEELILTLQAKKEEYNDKGYHFSIEKKLKHNEYKKAIS